MFFIRAFQRNKKTSPRCVANIKCRDMVSETSSDLVQLRCEKGYKVNVSHALDHCRVCEGRWLSVQSWVTYIQLKCEMISFSITKCDCHSSTRLLSSIQARHTKPGGWKVAAPPWITTIFTLCCVEVGICKLVDHNHWNVVGHIFDTQCRKKILAPAIQFC